MPGDLGSLGAMLAVDDPGMVLGHGQVHVLESEHLASRDHSERDSKAVQLVCCQITIQALKMRSVLVVAPGERVPNNI